jgi:glutamyl-tRNA synthetase
MIRSFSLERVNKAAASFDATKLFSFQEHYMGQLSVEEKLERCLPYLQRAGYLDRIEADGESRTRAILSAAADRIRVAGDILDYDDFFTADNDLVYDEATMEKRLRKPEDARELLLGFRERLAEIDIFDAEQLEVELKSFVEQRETKIGRIIHALRIATTGRPVGFGMFETLAILGRASCLARIDRALALL